MYVDPERGGVRGLPEAVRIWDRHLRAAPAYRSRIGTRERVRLAALRAASAVARPLPPRVGRLIDGQRGLDVPPAQLFGEPLRSAAFDRLLFLATHDLDAIETAAVDPLEIARRTAFSLQHERRGLLAAYDAFRFAFPHRACTLLEEAPERERALLEAAFAGKPAIAVTHPYPVPIARVADRVALTLEVS